MDGGTDGRTEGWMDRISLFQHGISSNYNTRNIKIWFAYFRIKIDDYLHLSLSYELSGRFVICDLLMPIVNITSVYA